MVRTSQYNTFGQEHYLIYINDAFFAEFNSISFGKKIAQTVSITVFGKLADH